ncbi:hypothetical protein SDRG_09127 [Saprolegnia diclina VS20]|uniref:Uncharacterized protein n=1 Tax=Saprolegnia diclina (strain VS20) TaxID=1156394 RepID=T0QHI7_SAPDV|nr:hypothetical protein SDRG_09127 [Saprolegnia diclina VS20]EQC33140.1 hypothetical protein SDRG_09127 [Saprolegnia diclina VS20]|eukprot:XP_008613263.1 hypothetical protein SDRG_09127 [Saprolegnia diclina VS20]
MADLGFFRAWADDERMEALYSSSVLNDHTLAKLWLPALHWSTHGLRYHPDGTFVQAWPPSLLLSRDELPRRFERRGIEPVPVVIDHLLTALVQAHELVTPSELLERCNAKSKLGWFVDVAVKRPMRWGWASLWHAIAAEDDSRLSHDSPYLSLPTLASLATHVHAYALSTHEPLARVFCLGPDHVTCATKDHAFHMLCRAASRHDEASPPAQFLAAVAADELDYIAFYLVYTKRAVMQAGLIKLVVLDATADAIGDGDRTVLLLYHTISTVETALATLQARVAAVAEKALEAKRRGSAAEALALWRHAKTLQADVDQRQNALVNLLSTKHQLGAMSAQATILEGYKLAAESLRSVRASLHLSTDAVAETLADWSDVMDEQRHMDDLLTAHADYNVDEAALEMELLSLAPPSPSPVAVSTAAGQAEPVTAATPPPAPAAAPRTLEGISK